VSTKSFFNAGSVGNPLDMPLASYIVLSVTLDCRTVGAFSIEFVRLPYDIEREIEEAYRVGVPEAELYAVELRTAVYRRSQKEKSAV
jgi:protein phosphatase